MRSHIETRLEAAIIEPSSRPPDPKLMSSARRRFGVALLAVGFLVVLLGTFLPSAAQWLFIAGSVLIFIGLALLGRFVHGSRKDRDIRKHLYDI
jgi:cytochrome c biogenesis protein CcdA